jgi:hypothetical protein
MLDRHACAIQAGEGGRISGNTVSAGATDRLAALEPADRKALAAELSNVVRVPGR